MSVSAADCLAFEDSHNGLLSARGAGLETLITVNDYTRDQDFSGALLVLDQLGTREHGFTVLAGELPNGAAMVDVGLLHALHSK